MRLLLRANSHRLVDPGVTELAAAPDTPLRERWQWHLRLHDCVPEAAEGSVIRTVRRGDGGSQVLEVTADPGIARPDTELIEAGSRVEVRRAAEELLVLVVHRGAALVEQRHLLAELDAMVLEGDDPLSVSVDPADSVDSGHSPLGVAVVRLTPTNPGPLAWVP